MKKGLLILSFIAAVSSVMAQSGYYHQVGDTVRGKCPIYQYEQGWWPTLNASGHTDSLINTAFSTFGYMKHTTNTPLKVIGIASTWARLDMNNHVEDMDASIDGTLYYVLCEATSSGPVELARVCWTADYMTHPKRYMELPLKTGLCSNMEDHDTIVSLREYYFDSAITVTDSFYLGCVIPDPTVTDFDGFSYIASHIWDYCTYSSMDANGTYKECATDMPEFIYYDSSRLDTTWRHHTYKRFQLVFPIIEVDTFCITPEEPQVADRDSLRVRVEWTDASNLSWEVSRTTPGGDPDTGLITPTTNPYIEYTDIDNDSAYHVYVRGYCETGIWSGWSDWSTPCLIDSIPTPPTPPDPVGIATIETADFALSPNPTDGTVQLIGLLDELTSVEVLDIKGHLLKAFENTTVFSISDLNAGTYIVRVKTLRDNTEKVTYLKLVKK
ncbi:MAG: T9SS type A sorting domain-containing protein [Bacteroidales bacterium]|nr:T9SS type A sorting domain-containing protein [Bacteroidales bacterium]